MHLETENILDIEKEDQEFIIDCRKVIDNPVLKSADDLTKDDPYILMELGKRGLANESALHHERFKRQAVN